MTISTTSALQSTTSYGPFSKYIDVYGLKILGLSGIGSQPEVRDEFLKKTAQTFKLLLNPNAAGIDAASRTRALEGLNSYNVIQRVGVGSYDAYSPSLDSGSYPGWHQVNDSNNATDFIWHLRDRNGSFSPSGKNQTTEILEHALHTLSQFALPSAFPNELNVFSSNGRADGISGDLSEAYQEAVRNGVYDPSDYSGANDGSDGYAQLLLREYVFCLIFAEWGFTQALVEGGTLAPEWSDSHLSQAAIARDNPIGHRLFTNNISKIISKPSLQELGLIFKDGDQGLSGYLPSNAQAVPEPPKPEAPLTPDPSIATPTQPIPEQPQTPLPLNDRKPILDHHTQTPLSNLPSPASVITPTPPIETAVPIDLKPNVIPDESPIREPITKETNRFAGKGRKKLRGTTGITNFIFKKAENFTKKNADLIIRFNPDEGDRILFDLDEYVVLSEDLSFKKARSKRKLKSLAKEDIDLIYFQKKGALYINGNGPAKGLGDPDKGGLLAILKGNPGLTGNDLQSL